MVEIVLVLIGGYLFVQTAGYLIHWVLHQPIMGRLHKTHNDHHREKYTPEDYLDKTYRHVAGNNRPILYYTPPALLIVAFAFMFLSPLLAAIFTVELAVVAWANDWLHTQMHIEGHWLERYRWFWRLRDLHWHHHVDEGKNLGIFSWFTDKLLGTFEEPKDTPAYYKTPAEVLGSTNSTLPSIEEVSESAPKEAPSKLTRL